MGPPAPPTRAAEPPTFGFGAPGTPSSPRSPPGFGGPGTPHSRCSCGTRSWPCRVWAPPRSRGPAGGQPGMGTGTGDWGQGDIGTAEGSRRGRGHTLSHFVTHNHIMSHLVTQSHTINHTVSHGVTDRHTLSPTRPGAQTDPGVLSPIPGRGPAQAVPVGDSLRVPAQPPGAVGPPRAGPDPPTPQLPMASGPPSPLQGTPLGRDPSGRGPPRGGTPSRGDMAKGCPLPPGLGWPGRGCPPPGECPDPPGRTHRLEAAHGGSGARGQPRDPPVLWRGWRGGPARPRGDNR